MQCLHINEIMDSHAPVTGTETAFQITSQEIRYEYRFVTKESLPHLFTEAPCSQCRDLTLQIIRLPAPATGAIRGIGAAADPASRKSSMNQAIAALIVPGLDEVQIGLTWLLTMQRKKF